MILVKKDKVIFKVLQFIGTEKSTVAVVVAICTENWKELKSTGYETHNSQIYGEYSKKLIYSFDISELFLFQDSEIPAEFKRDYKLKYLLENEI